ncbi:MAG: phosphate ABC transporter permease PstA [Alphaproteobacteria bacterium]|jgi:phosphate transport system permease protein|uniref:Phosphate transport system permease protein PstA n=2 Tax=Rhizobium/Agrobacterium group TaxID=227290 RepID=A0A922P2I1_9HYPH|nr:MULTISPECIES: phosphate ABC transporter permease PstA [Pseudorhizobium]MBA4786350.1 phosphate ABC transporter permease PstA [Hyphomicrobiales bacterium]MBU1317540.1 phosphate ABC transporter permease PstA [Alphaproteobacteria bacterium]MDY6961096.1 phosphate ABC transporter permease PstA [Pseudomonadota bacterium]KEQ04108.1 phosphate ABC transporter permease [Pseudorhizobium pelagicum]KEQ04994.1 phosphate ABC transporter permease [Pseudorhizobium pelagicum]
MTDMTAATPAKSPSASEARTRRRNASERRFRLMGLIAVAIGVLALVGLLVSIFANGASTFRQTYITLDIYLDPARLDKSGARDIEEISKVSTFGYAPLIEDSLAAAMAERGLTGIDADDAADLISGEEPAMLRRYVLNDPSQIGETVEFNLLASGRIDGYYKGRVTMASAELDRNVSPEQLMLADELKEAGILTTRFNWDFFTNPDASDTRPEAAGLGVAILGSLYMMLIVLVLSLPIGVAASIYLEEFAPRNRLTDLIEVNIANLAAVPSIVFGILGLAVFINFVGLPQSAPVVGGLVLTLMTLPTIIIATRAALKAVPPSIRDAALGVGASKMQAIFHHVVPLAMPGILTGTIIGLAQALGETAPLLLIGMVAFVREYPAGPPEGFFDPASALPVQVYNWTQRGDPAFFERASGAIIVLLVFLLFMNLIAIILRRRFERRW